MQSSPRPSKTLIDKDLTKYAYFIAHKYPTVPELRAYLKDRLQDRDFSILVTEHKEKALLLCLQVLSDIIVHSLHPQNLEAKSPNKTVIRENEALMRSISQHNLKMERLNKEITQGSGLHEHYRSKDIAHKESASLLNDT